MCLGVYARVFGNVCVWECVCLGVCVWVCVCVLVFGSVYVFGSVCECVFGRVLCECI